MPLQGGEHGHWALAIILLSIRMDKGQLTLVPESIMESSTPHSDKIQVKSGMYQNPFGSHRPLSFLCTCSILLSYLKLFGQVCKRSLQPPGEHTVFLNVSSILVFMIACLQERGARAPARYHHLPSHFHITAAL